MTRPSIDSTAGTDPSRHGAVVRACNLMLLWGVLLITSWGCPEDEPADDDTTQADDDDDDDDDDAVDDDDDDVSFEPGWTDDPTDSPYSGFGHAVAGGDVDGDGYGDLVVGAHHWMEGGSIRGKVFVYAGGADGPLPDPWQTDMQIPSNATFGSAVAVADVHGDGYDDVVVAAQAWGADASTEGRVFLYEGGPAGLPDEPAWWVDPTDQQTGYFGSGLSLGDVDADGYADILIGAKGFTGEESREGAAYLYPGSADGPPDEPTWMVHPTDQFSATFGNAVASGGDLDGDGYDEVVVAAQVFDAELQSEGRIYLYTGGPDGPPAAASQTLDPTDIYAAFFGSALDITGDVNGDGFDDLLVGADNLDAEADSEGRAYLFLGSSAGVDPNPVWSADPTDLEGASFGEAVALADFDGDGYCDVIVGASWVDDEAQNEGRAYLYSGGPGGPAQQPCALCDPTDVEASRFGISTAGVGDINGDGGADVAIGAYRWGTDVEAEGRVFLFFGATP